ncbi:hypothetical protein EC604_17810 [Paenibacillus amylolyticus]|uniref:Heparinase II/III-like protein n=1 Tax=Paenibacillus amylolyticus TaxID=1451 RepID=A0A5M9WVL8_PAEAM|nr:heparinase II/III family protein [Paenibacillus amylolyticus]KAA8785690.1 hypothetical protein EC604_17810 [Paenibacillus amylolyticus]
MRLRHAVDESGVLDWLDEQRIRQVFGNMNKQNHGQDGAGIKADELREKLFRPEFAEMLTDLRRYGEQALREPLPLLTFHLFRQFGRAGDRKAYEQVYFERRGRLAAVAMLALDSDAPHMVHALEEMLWAVCDEYTWCLPAHLGTGEAEHVGGNIDLFAAETVHMLAEIVVLHRHHLDSLIVERILLEAERRIFTPLYREKRAYHWQTAEHNWSAVCGGCCGMAAMLLLEDQAMLLESTRQTIDCMKAFLSGYGEDGGCAEGIGYWVYGFGYYVYYAEMLLDYTEGALDLLQGSKIAAIAAFPLRIHLSDGTFINYSDSSEYEEIPSGLLSLLAVRFGMEVDLPLRIPQLTDDPCRRWAHLLRNVMWSDPAVYERIHGETARRANGGFIFQQLEWMVAKHALHMPTNVWVETSRRCSDREWIQVACSFKGGHNDEPHNHNDLGQVIIHCGGENILCDPGAGVYTQAYFAPGREQLFHISSAGHNVPLIGGCEQRSGREAEAKLLEFRLEPDGSEMQACLDLTHAYPETAALHRYTRHLSWKVGQDRDGMNRITGIKERGGRGCSTENPPDPVDLVERIRSTDRQVDVDYAMDVNLDVTVAMDTGVHVDMATLRIIDKFQWKMDTEADVAKSSLNESYVESQVVERWISRIRPVIEKEGRLRWQASQAHLYMIYDAVQWRVQTEAVHTVDHDQVPVTFYRTSLIWKGNGVTATKGEDGRVENERVEDALEASENSKILESAETVETSNVAPLEIVCQVDFIVEPHQGEAEVSPRE